MPSGFWSCSCPVGYGQVLGSRRSTPSVWAECQTTANASTYLGTVQKDSFRPFKSSDKNVTQQNTRSFLRARKTHRWLSKNVQATRLRVDSSLSRSRRRGTNEHRLSWVEKHLEITEKHMGDVEKASSESGWSVGLLVEPSNRKEVTEYWFNTSQLCHKEGQRWGIIGHTIESDINPMCPKGEQL